MMARPARPDGGTGGGRGRPDGETATAGPKRVTSADVTG